MNVEDLQNFPYNEKELAEKIATATEDAYEKGELTQAQYEAIKATR